MINPAKKLYHYYFYRIRLKSKFLVSHLLLALLPAIVLASFSYSRFSGIITSNTIQSLEAISQNTSTSIEAVISQVQAAQSAVTTNSFFTSFIQSSAPTYDSEEDFTRDLQGFMDSAHYLVDGKTITSMHIYMDDRHYNMTRKYFADDLFRPISMASGSYWSGILKNSDDNILVCPSMYLSPTEVQEDGELAIIRKLNLSNDRTAYIAVYFSQASINQVLLQDIPFHDSVFYLINQRESIVTTTNPTLSGTYFLKYNSIPESIPNTSRFVKLNFVDENVYVGYKEITGTDWYMVSAIPATNIVSKSNVLLLEFVILYVVFLFTGIFASLMLSNSIIYRLSNIIHQMKNVKYGPPAKLKTTHGEDEIADLVDTYNFMADEINLLLDEQAKAAEELRLSEFHALQSQINPHFLYNTLDMINWQALSGHAQDVSEAVQVLSRFYKLTLSRGKSIVTIQDELEHVSLYIRLQNMRYNDRIHYIVDIPDEMLEYQIPKLIFQPIVENALLHGILEKEDKEGHVIIMGWIEDEQLVFVVSDNGVGISQEKIDEILSGKGSSQTGSNIGVYNTHRRLQLFYNNSAGLSFRSNPGVETEVEIRIPKIRVPS